MIISVEWSFWYFVLGAGSRPSMESSSGDTMPGKRGMVIPKIARALSTDVVEAVRSMFKTEKEVVLDISI